MRSGIKLTRDNIGLTAEYAESAELSMRNVKRNLMRRLGLFFPMLIILMLSACDQSPTTLDEEPYLADSDDVTFAIEITSFEFDFLSQQFFFSIAVSSPLPINQVSIIIQVDEEQHLMTLNDEGLEGDILVGDGHYDGSWTLPDSLSMYIEEVWTLHVYASDNAATQIEEIQIYRPQLPAPPSIGNAVHLDTLTLSAADLVLDTLSLSLSHPNGLDEIRDVSMMSLKPDGNYANNGQPIPLYDDGGSVIFYSFGGIDFTSGDSLANDGVYSLLLALAPDNLNGVYHWTFNSRTWLGIEAIPVLDSIVVLPAPSLARGRITHSGLGGVFK